jgi:hypothetical protein
MHWVHDDADAAEVVPAAQLEQADAPELEFE